MPILERITNEVENYSNDSLASKSQLAYAEFRYYNYLAHQDGDNVSDYNEMSKIDETMVR